MISNIYVYILFCLVFFISTFFDLFSGYISVVVLILGYIVFDIRYKSCMLILITSIQDAPGYNYYASYISFLLLSWLTSVQVYIKNRKNININTSERIDKAKYIFIFTILLCLYNLCNSFIQDIYGINDQKEYRNFLLVSVFCFTHIITAYIVVKYSIIDKIYLQSVYVTALISIFIIIGIGASQVVFGQTFYRSSQMIDHVTAAKQLIENTVLGFPRINGPYLSANAFGLYTSILLIIFLIYRPKVKLNRTLFFYVLIAFIISIFSMSKAIVIYQAMTIGMLVLIEKKRSRFVYVSIVVLSPILIGIATNYSIFSQLNEPLEAVFRVNTETLGTRGEAWSAVFMNFSLINWMFGIGLTGWPSFFVEHVGIPLADPHNTILSFWGGFGLLGIIYYLSLTSKLGNLCINNRFNVRVLSGGVALLIIMTVKDFVSIQSIIGNSTATYLLWFSIYSLFIFNKK